MEPGDMNTSALVLHEAPRPQDAIPANLFLSEGVEGVRDEQDIPKQKAPNDDLMGEQESNGHDDETITEDPQHSQGSAASNMSGISSMSSRGRLGILNKRPPALKKEPANVDRFCSDAAKERYQKYKGKLVVLDKGFSERNLMHSLIKELIEKNGWKKFALHNYDPVSWELMREFFANLVHSEDRFSWVRGKVIDYTPRRLNEFFQLRGIRPQFTCLNTRLGHKSREAGDAVAATFCKNRMPNYGPTAFTFSENFLDESLLPFTDFFFTKFNITLHTNEASGSMLYPLYRILRGEIINVGAWISQMIFRRRSDLRLVLCYPSLIKALCKEAGVQMSHFEMNLDMGPAIQLPPDEDIPFRFDPIPFPELGDDGDDGADPDTTPRPTACKKKRRRKVPVQVSPRQAEKQVPSQEQDQPRPRRPRTKPITEPTLAPTPTPVPLSEPSRQASEGTVNESQFTEFRSQMTTEFSSFTDKIQTVLLSQCEQTQRTQESLIKAIRNLAAMHERSERRQERRLERSEQRQQQQLELSELRHKQQMDMIQQLLTGILARTTTPSTIPPPPVHPVQPPAPGPQRQPPSTVQPADQTPPHPPHGADEAQP